MPIIITIFIPSLDQFFCSQKFIHYPYNWIVSLFLIIPGIIFSVWSISVQFNIGKGTPIPTIPPKKLIINGPYSYCRNPMGFGIGIYYLGFGIFISSIISIGFIILFMFLLLSYYKFIEEKELEKRFGKEYTQYKKRTPFLIPRFPKKKLE